LLLFIGLVFIMLMQFASGLGVQGLAGQTIFAFAAVVFYGLLFYLTGHRRRWPAWVLIGLASVLSLTAMAPAVMGYSKPRLLASALVSAAYPAFAVLLDCRRLRSTRRAA